MDSSVSGCSRPRNCWRAKWQSSINAKAFLCRPWFLYINERLAFALIVSWWSRPSSILQVSITCTYSLSDWAVEVILYVKAINAGQAESVIEEGSDLPVNLLSQSIHLKQVGSFRKSWFLYNSCDNCGYRPDPMPWRSDIQQIVTGATNYKVSDTYLYTWIW